MSVTNDPKEEEIANDIYNEDLPPENYIVRWPLQCLTGVFQNCHKYRKNGSIPQKCCHKFVGVFFLINWKS